MCMGAIGVVTEVGEVGGMPFAVVDFGDRSAEVGVMIGESLHPGTPVLVHSGFILEALDPDRAAEMLALRTEMTEPGSG